jgi:uncharacterized NAD(P)/FAD-binding protein YdhS
MSAREPTIAIVGAGASGVLAALHLLDSPGPPVHLLLVERSGKTGRGVAFSTDRPSHLLNVPAASMSAFERDPGHLVRWLGGNGFPNAEDAFVLFGQYLGESLLSRAHLREGNDVVEITRDQVVDIEVGVDVDVDAAAGPTLVFARRQPAKVDAVVLATGNLPTRWPRDLENWQDNERCISDPWRTGVLDQIGLTSTVTLLGTGLTAVDVLLALAEKGHHGSIRAISRHGLLPRAHLSGPQPTAIIETTRLEQGDRRTRLLLRQLRDAVAEEEALGGDWRAVIDMLRPETQGLWQSLPPSEQLRFRRHGERFWNVHRHRMAPAVAEQLHQLRDSGVFRSLAGRVVAIEPSPDALQLEVRLPSIERRYRWGTDWLVNCTGPSTFAFSDDQVLAQSLRRRGLARPGHLDAGIDTDAGGRVLTVSGQPIEWMWALGSLRQGQLLETTAVPEIRSQALHVASAVRQWLAGKASGPASIVDNYEACEAGSSSDLRPEPAGKTTRGVHVIERIPHPAHGGARTFHLIPSYSMEGAAQSPVVAIAG